MAEADPAGKRTPQPRSQRAIANRFTAIERNLEWLRQGLARYPDAYAFTHEWLSDDFDASTRIAALERFYERIANSVNQLIDTVEAELVRRGEIADPQQEGGPGRAQRLAAYGIIEPDEVAQLRRFLERRNVLQKEYPDLGADAARDAYEDATALVGLIPGLVPGLRGWARSAGFPI